MSVVRIVERGSVWVLSFARPPMNAIDLDLVNGFAECVARAAAADACRALVVTGDPPAFCAGIDVKVVPAYNPDTLRSMVRTVNRTVRSLYGVAKPTVAAINGHAIGGGLVIALACDFRLAANSSYKLGLTEIAAGIPFPAAPMVVVQAELEPRSARHLVLSGATFGPTDPLAAAFVDLVVEPERLIDRALEQAASASRLPSYATVKRQLRGDALRQIDDIVTNDRDPMLQTWMER